MRGFFAGVGVGVGFAVLPVLLSWLPAVVPVVLPVPVAPPVPVLLTFVVPVAVVVDPVLDVEPGLVGVVGDWDVGSEVIGVGKSGKGLLRMLATNSVRPVVDWFRSL